MMIAGSIEYAQVRIQARYAARTQAADWRAIEHARELPALIKAVRGSGFARVLAQLPASPGLHELDVVLRKQWRERVAEVAGWMPADWQAAVRWCALIVDLPFIRYLAEGGVPSPWMQHDRCFAYWRAQREPEAAASGWYREWRRRMPRLSEQEAAQFLVFVRTVESHLGAFSGAPADAGWRHRQVLQQKLTTLFRRSTLEPLAAFALLALEWLDLERLRGEIATRIAFPSRRLVP